MGISSTGRLRLMNMLDAFESLGRGDCLGDIAPFACPPKGLKHAGLRPSYVSCSFVVTNILTSSNLIH